MSMRSVTVTVKEIKQGMEAEGIGVWLFGGGWGELLVLGTASYCVVLVDLVLTM